MQVFMNACMQMNMYEYEMVTCFECLIHLGMYLSFTYFLFGDQLKNRYANEIGNEIPLLKVT